MFCESLCLCSFSQAVHPRSTSSLSLSSSVSHTLPCNASPINSFSVKIHSVFDTPFPETTQLTDHFLLTRTHFTRMSETCVTVVAELLLQGGVGSLSSPTDLGFASVWRRLETSGLPGGLACMVFEYFLSRRKRSGATLTTAELSAFLAKGLLTKAPPVYMQLAQQRGAILDGEPFEGNPDLAACIHSAGVATTLPHCFAAPLYSLWWKHARRFEARLHIPLCELGSEEALFWRNVPTELCAALLEEEDGLNGWSEVVAFVSAVRASPMLHGFRTAAEAERCLAQSTAELSSNFALSSLATYGAQRMGYIFVSPPDFGLDTPTAIAELSRTTTSAELGVRAAAMWRAALHGCAKLGARHVVISPVGLHSHSAGLSAVRRAKLAGVYFTALFKQVFAGDMREVWLALEEAGLREEAAACLAKARRSQPHAAVRVMLQDGAPSRLALQLSTFVAEDVCIVSSCYAGATAIGHIIDGGHTASMHSAESTCGVVDRRFRDSVVPAVWSCHEEKYANSGLQQEVAGLRASLHATLQEHSVVVAEADEHTAALQESLASEALRADTAQQHLNTLMPHTAERKTADTTSLISSETDRRAHIMHTEGLTRLRVLHAASARLKENTLTLAARRKERKSVAYFGIEVSDGVTEVLTRGGKVTERTRLYPLGSKMEGCEVPFDGVVVHAVVPFGPGAQAGLEQCDIIVSVCGAATLSAAAFRAALRGRSCTSPITLTVRDTDAVPREVILTPEERRISVDDTFGPVSRKELRRRSAVHSAPKCALQGRGLSPKRGVKKVARARREEVREEKEAREVPSSRKKGRAWGAFPRDASPVPLAR